ncbi:MAG TPA: LuxR C-terminal-related transcriptional regulator [Nocardioidaceae bacterium]|nr:LuxR C-terminal-related transcriptional regulator [Nocardioidaceae bacterium]
MAECKQITDDDVKALLALVEHPVPNDDEEPFYSEVLTGLRALIPCDDMTFQLMDVGRRQVSTVSVTDAGIELEEGTGDEPDEFMDVFWSEFWTEHGCAGPLATDDYETVLGAQFLDARSRAEELASPMGELFAKQGVKHELLVPMRPRGPLDRRLLLWRFDEPGFGERELALLRLVRPHLSELQIRRERELSGIPELTARQWEIMRQVSMGHSNAQIARILGLSQATVRKHLENIFLRLRVASRTEAVHRVRDFLGAA